MKPSDVLTAIEFAPSTTKQVACSIIGNKSSSTRNAAKSSVKAIAKNINNTPVHWTDFVKQVDVETFMVFACEDSFKRRRTLKHRLLIQPFQKIWLRLLAFVYDLNFSSLNESAKDKNSDYYQIGDGIVLAGLYFLLSEQSF